MSTLENLDATTALLQQLERHIDILYHFVLSCGITPKDRKLSTLTELLKEVKVLKPKVNYVAYATNQHGYISEAVNMKTFTQVEAMPKDILRGYYRVDEKGNLVIDHARKSILWGD
jgi:hypothetical protein